METLAVTTWHYNEFIHHQSLCNTKLEKTNCMQVLSDEYKANTTVAKRLLMGDCWLSVY